MMISGAMGILGLVGIPALGKGFGNPYYNDPELFIREVLGFELVDYQKKIVDLYVKEKRVCANMGFGTGATFLTACFALWHQHAREETVLISSSFRRYTKFVFPDIQKMAKEANIKLDGSIGYYSDDYGYESDVFIGYQIEHVSFGLLSEMEANKKYVFLTRSSEYIASRFKCKTINISAEDVPHWIIDQKYIRKMENEYGRNSDIYKRNVLGHFG